MASLAEIRARITASENKSQNKGSGAQDNAIYPFWNISEGTTSTVRFVPDGDPKNTFFWVERQVIKLPFNGVKGDSNSKKVTVQVPCVEMFGENCPILAEVRPWYKDDALKDMAGTYWKKRSYLFQGFVRQNPLGDDKTPANPIRRFIISSSLFTLIKASLMDPELDELPTDYTNGLDFNIKKTKQGQYADYSTSSWARKASPLTEVELAAIDAHGLFNLAEFLPKKPSESELRVIKEMFEASVDGRAYDPDKWGAYYRPYGVDVPNNGSTSTATNATKAPVVIEPDDAVETSDPVVVPKKEGTDKAQDILAMIRQRQAAAKS